MKKIITATVLLAIASFSCKKDAVKKPSIMGIWSVISDSTSLSGNASFEAIHTNYIGQSSDYYDFRADGNLYVREGELLDTMAFEVVGDNQVRCTPSPGFTSDYNTTVLTDSTASLEVSGVTAQGQLYKMVHLKK